MDDIELLDWQFRIAKMGRSELEVTLRAMADPDAKPFSLHDPEAVARLARQSLIGSTEAMLNRAPSNVGSGPGGGKRTVTVDLRGYYEAKTAEDAEAQDRADRAEIRAMCERRLAHMDARDRFRYSPAPSPLQSYIKHSDMASVTLGCTTIDGLGYTGQNN